MALLKLSDDEADLRLLEVEILSMVAAVSMFSPSINFSIVSWFRTKLVALSLAVDSGCTFRERIGGIVRDCGDTIK